jgi:hypothetical protein
MNETHRRWFALAAFALLAPTSAGCPSPVAETTTFEDEGEVCVRDSEEWNGEADVPADQMLYVHVHFPTCISSSCDEVVEATCSASRDGQTIEVTSFGESRRTGISCTDDCGYMVATCELGELAAGTYTVVHGGEESTVEVPSAQDQSCFF